MIDALDHDEFARGKATTAFIAENFDEDKLADKALDSQSAAIAAVLQAEQLRNLSLSKSLPVPCELLGWASATKIATPYKYDEHSVAVTPFNGRDYQAGEHLVSVLSLGDHRSTFSVDENRITVSHYSPNEASISLSVDGAIYNLTNGNAVFSSALDEGGAGIILAPMHGAVMDVFVNEGDQVKAGQRLAILEAMKMQHEILADIDGKITSVGTIKDAQIAADTLMFEIEESK